MGNAKIIDGKARAAEMSETITADVAELHRSTGIRPGLAVVIVGEDPASQVYVRNKKRTAESCGFHSVQRTLPATISQEDLLQEISGLNSDPDVHGILVQLPLPRHLDELAVTQAILPQKDVDGFHFQNIGMLTSGNLSEAFVPCTPAGCMLMIRSELGDDLSGKSAVIIGRSNIVTATGIIFK
jgi:methylenetetrahydrofolate dehydrogenase (NADP+)/methenyltetrahydrofolate cyclohydrolase